MSRMLTIATLAMTLASTDAVFAQKSLRRIIEPTPAPAGRYSEKLHAHFAVEYVNVGGYYFEAARLTANPLPGSPLNSLGLRSGDIISRLDNRRVTSYWELENHYSNTSVRYFSQSAGRFLDGQIFIPNSNGGGNGGGQP